MPCPVCPGVCRCGGNDSASSTELSEHVAVVIDPERYDRSEESFSASLENSEQREPDVATALEAAARSERLAQLRPARRTIVLAEPKVIERPLEQGEWRREVSSRVNRYRARRRPRVERPRSLGLNFDPVPPSPPIPIRKESAALATPPVIDPELPSQANEPEASAVSAELNESLQQNIVEAVNEPTASLAAPANEKAADPEELTAMQIELYGVERYWPRVAPRNESPFWKQALAAAQFQPIQLQTNQLEPVQPQAVHVEQVYEEPAVHESPVVIYGDPVVNDNVVAAKDVVITTIKDNPVAVETPVVFSEQLDGSIISDLTEAVFAAEQSAPEDTIETPVTLNSVEVSPAHNVACDEELADPVVLTQHVFEEEEIHQAELAALSEISVKPAQPIAVVELPAEESPAPAPGAQALLLVAPIYQRVLMEAVDFCVSGAGFLLFCFILMWAGALPEGQAFNLMSAVVPGLFWALYQYVFLVNSGSTLGMRVAGLKLTSFDGDTVSPARRRARALSIGLSTFALGLGFLWVLLDEDHLCWHDRASKTFVTRRMAFGGEQSFGD